MKYKDFKVLSKDDMRTIYGGNEPEEPGADEEEAPGGSCNSTCTKTVGSVVTIGSCSEKTYIIGGVSKKYCKCSVSGGSGCGTAS